MAQDAYSLRMYSQRRARLRRQLGSGLVLLLGNDESPMNYADNPYPFRQDSSFLYFFGLDSPGLAALVDVEEEREIVFGRDPTVEEIVWTGPGPSLSAQLEEVGIREAAPPSALPETLQQALRQGRTVHYLPPYRCDHELKIHHLLGVPLSATRERASTALIKAVVEQRSVKSNEEIAEIESALEITREMQTAAMRITGPGRYEREIAGAMEGIALVRGVRLAFPTIFSVRGEVLHNHSHDNLMRDGELAVNDCGAESVLHYAGDITRTIPVGGKFSEKQREIYAIVLEAQRRAIEAVRPGVEFREVHRLAAERLVEGLKAVGLMKGDAKEAVEAGAHTLFFPCGLGHMLGLDVHDMEALGEDYVGYTEAIKRRPEFGWRSLRLARQLEPGFVVTVEPGLYFIPQLIDRWKSERRCEEFINYERIEEYRAFGGIRIEDDVAVTEGGRRVLGRAIPKTIEEVEEAMAR